ncbi:MAG TPA: DUF393 domain-containing protein [Steroidobacteraceae bacterium]|nr:DUF393 domain-containing protein [Steroidobacteraceae bacterium]
MTDHVPGGSAHRHETVLTVFFDGACPLCRREIDFYRRQSGSERIDWFDLSTAAPDRPVAPGLDLETALARMHVMHPDGTFASGAGAFAAVWRSLPRFARLGRVASLRPITLVLELGYRVFLRLRPLWRAQPTDRCDARCETDPGRTS